MLGNCPPAGRDRSRGRARQPRRRGAAGERRHQNLPGRTWSDGWSGRGGYAIVLSCVLAERLPPLRKVAVTSEELAREMAAARKRRAEKTARQLKEARIYAIRSGLRPGSSRQEVEERARSFYPRLTDDLLEEAVTLICGPVDPEKTPEQSVPPPAR